MNRGLATATLLGGALLGPVLNPARTQTAQNNPVKGASDFSSVDYCDPPNQMKISSRLSGVQAQPLAGDLMLVKQMKLETFDTNGTPRYIVEAPECIYDRLQDTANSAGPLKVRQADGQLELTGEGFAWHHDTNAGFLVISNQVHTMIKTGSNSKVRP